MIHDIGRRGFDSEPGSGSNLVQPSYFPFLSPCYVTRFTLYLWKYLCDVTNAGFTTREI
jgi:hypothetical protein